MSSETSGKALFDNTFITVVKKYTAGGHKLLAHGITFHQQCLLLCAYKSLASGKEFCMASEVVEAGKFNDLVYFHEVDGKRVCEQVQCKHREKTGKTEKPLSWSVLVGNAGQYSLFEYFKSYLEFSASFEVKFDCSINSCVLLTNWDLGKNTKELNSSENFELKDILDLMPDTRLFCNGISYRFKPEYRAAIRDIFIKKFNFEDKFAANVEILKTIAPNVEIIEKLTANVEMFKNIVPKFETLEKVAANAEILEKFDGSVEIFRKIVANVETLEKFAANEEILKFAKNVKTFDEIVPNFAKLEKFTANVEILEKIGANVEKLQKFVPNVEIFKKTAANVEMLKKFAANIETLEKTAVNVEMSEKTAANSNILQKFAENVEILKKIATNFKMFFANVKILEKLAPNVVKLKSVLDKVSSTGDDFLKKFVLCVMNNEEVGQIEMKIKQEIQTCLKNQMKKNKEIVDNLHRVDDIYMCLYNRMHLFHSSRDDMVATENDCLKWLLEANEKMGGDAVHVQHEKNMYHLFTDYGTKLFTKNSIQNLKDFLTNCNGNKFCIIGRHCTDFALLKLVQVLDETGKRFHVINDDQFLPLSDKKVIIREYLIVRCSGKWNEVVEKTRKVLGNSTGKKIALVIGFKDRSVLNRICSDCSGLDRICDETGWSDLTEDTRQRLRHKSISFQGTNIPFSALNISEVEEWIDERVLDGIFHESLNISTRFDDEKSEERDYFVKRRIGRRNRIDLESIRSTVHVFVVENMTELEYKSFIAEKRFDETRFCLGRESDFNDFCEKNPKKNISLLYYADNKFYWKKSYGESIEHLISKDFDAPIDLNDVTCITDQTVLIVAEPGMGKSYLLSVLLEKSVEKRPDVWIVKINLTSHSTRFNDMQDKQERFCKQSAIDFVVESQSFKSFESNLFRSYFDLEGKLIVLLDGFDEISPGYRETVLDLIANLKSIPTIRLWLTSRPQERGYLETGLGLMSYSLLEFSDEDQKKFFTRFWLRSGDVVDARAYKFIDRLLSIACESFRNTERLVTGIPLQCRMLGEVYRPEFDGFYRSESVDPESLKVLDILDLYKEFISKIFDRYFKEKLKLEPAQQALQSMIKKEKNDLNESHKLLSLEIVFPHRFEATHATQLEEYKNCIVDGNERTGIVHSLDHRRPVFLHRTFAEYFAALWFHDELKKSDREKDKDLFDYLEENMFKSEYEVFREFFDRLSVRSDDPVLKHVLNGDIDSLERYPDPEIVSRVDDFRRNALHLAASYGHDCTVRFLVRRGIRVDARDRLFDWTPWKYGIGGGRALIPSSNGFRDRLDYDSIVSLLPGNEADRTMYDRITDRDKLLLDASKHGHGELVDYVLKHGTGVDVRDSDGRSPLHLAAENGSNDVCAALIEYGSPIDCRDQQGWTPLQYACSKRRTSTVKFLLCSGADVDTKDDINVTPLHRACVIGYKPTVALLLERNADTNAIDSENNTPLHNAFKFGRVAVVDAFVAHDADVLTRVNFAKTLLHSAAASGRVELVEKLLERSVAVDARDHQNRTPLDVAEAKNHEEIVYLLLANGARIRS